MTIPNSVKSIGRSVFLGCDALTSVTIPNGVTMIEDYTFYSCGLESLVIPEGVTSIGYEAFRFCSSLTNITIPESMTDLGTASFYDCKKLKTVYYNGSEEDSEKLDKILAFLWLAEWVYAK